MKGGNVVCSLCTGNKGSSSLHTDLVFDYSFLDEINLSVKYSSIFTA